MYKQFIRPILFSIDAERVHHLVFGILAFIGRLPGGRLLLREFFTYNPRTLSRTVMGIRFSNPVGLAAGFDKDARLVDELGSLGFGFVEIGTLTPRPQAGNERPRLFRLPKDQALVNRMGFNNEGVLAAVHRLKQKKTSVVVGGNIGKNKATPNEEATADYAYCFEALFDYVDYFVVNVSSPNTPGLRALQEKEPLKQLLDHIKNLSRAKPHPKPVLLKIAPDLTSGQLDDIIEIVRSTGIDGVIATNTTIDRQNLLTKKSTVDSLGNGGLSGKPLREKSTNVIRYLRQGLGKKFVIIGVGGIMSVEDALEKLKAGADLIQLYTGFIYEGPGFVRAINRALAEAK